MCGVPQRGCRATTPCCSYECEVVLGSCEVGLSPSELAAALDVGPGRRLQTEATAGAGLQRSDAPPPRATARSARAAHLRRRDDGRRARHARRGRWRAQGGASLWGLVSSSAVGGWRAARGGLRGLQGAGPGRDWRRGRRRGRPGERGRERRRAAAAARAEGRAWAGARAPGRCTGGGPGADGGAGDDDGADSAGGAGGVAGGRRAAHRRRRRATQAAG
eukprot:1501323-Prymnesium_polylepis.1